MRQQANGYVPPKVEQLLREARDIFKCEPELRRIASHCWRITCEFKWDDDSTVVIVITLKKSSRGRMPKPKIIMHVEGSKTHLRSWDTLKDLLISTGASLAPRLEEDPDLTPPIKLQNQKEAIQARLGPTVEVCLARKGTFWVLGIDNRTDECEERPCEHEFSLRFYYKWKHGGWKSDPKRFVAVVFGIDISEQWREQQSLLLRLLSKVISSSADDKRDHPDTHPQSSAPAGKSNAVTVRRATVFRI